LASNALKEERFMKKDTDGEKVGVMGMLTYQGEYTWGSSKAQDV
jgi:hypothetical protein